MADRWLYLGSVARIINKRDDGQHAKPRSGYALLRPIYQASADLTKWLRVEDGASDFPNRGFVTWYAPPRELTEDSLWQFHVEESLSYVEEKPEYDRFFVAKAPIPLPAREVIDLRRDDRPFVADDARREAVEEGIWLQYTPSLHIYLWVENSVWIGPLRLDQHDGKWRVASEQIQQTFIGSFTFQEKFITELRVEGVPRLILTPDAQTGATVRPLDWSSDDVVLRRVLGWVKSTLPAYANTVNLTKDAINKAAALALAGDPSDNEMMVRTQQLQRALSIVPTLEDHYALAQTLVEDLLTLPSVAAKTREAADAAVVQARTQVYAELAAETAEINELRSAKVSLKEEIRRLDREQSEGMAAVEQQMEEGKAALEAELSGKLSEVMNRPVETLANIAIIRAALNLAGSQAKAPGISLQHQFDAAPCISAEQGALRISYSRTEEHILPLQGQRELRQRLKDSYENRNIGPAVARMLYATFLSGSVPVLAGEAAYEALDCFASCVAGGRLLWLPVPAAALEPSDLLGRLNPSTQCFAPQAAGLLDLLIHASTSNDLFVVVLDGINRAPIDAYLSPILSCYTDAWLEQRRRRALALVHSSMMNPNDVYFSASHLVWPPNVLLAGIWAEGVMAGPAPSAFWDAAAMIPIHALSTWIENKSNSAKEDAPLSAVSMNVWREWRETNYAVTDLPQKLKDILKRLSEEDALLSERRRSVLKSFYAALREWTTTDLEALLETASCCLAAQMVVSGREQALINAFEQTNIANADFAKTIHLMRLLLS